jgi:hypothetical protein
MPAPAARSARSLSCRTAHSSEELHDPIWEAKLDSTAPDQSKGKLT